MGSTGAGAGVNIVTRRKPMPVRRVCGFEAGLNVSFSCANEVGIEYFWYVSGSFRFFYFISFHFYFVNSLCFAFLSVFRSVPFRFILFH